MISRSLACCLFAWALLGVANSQEQLRPLPQEVDPSQYRVAPTVASAALTLQLAVALRNIRKAEADLFAHSLCDRSSPTFMRWITPTEYGLRFGAPNVDVSRVTAYFRKYGLGVRTAENRLFVFISGTLAQCENAFHTRIGTFVRPVDRVAAGEPPTFYAPATPALLPASVASAVENVEGLSDLRLLHTDFGLAQAPPNPGLTPTELSGAYDSKPLQRATNYGSGGDIAIFSPTTRIKTDPPRFAQIYGLAPPTIIDHPLDGGPAQSTGQGEANLDIMNVMGQAQKARIHLFEPPLNTLANEMRAFEGVQSTGIKVLTSSWFHYESDFKTAQGMLSVEEFSNLAESMAMSGVSIFVAAGDHGAGEMSGTCFVPMPLMEPCSPWVTAVGGTNLFVAPDDSWLGEYYWQNYPPTWSGGGGLSQIFTRPFWQQGAGVFQPLYSNGKRQIPDVAANASPLTPYAGVYNGVRASGFGTSGAAPLWAANALLIDQYLRPFSGKASFNLGLMNPALYRLGDEFENYSNSDTDQEVDFLDFFYVFHDILDGFNGAEPGEDGWDFCTGWGSADFAKLAADLGNVDHVPGLLPNYQPALPSPDWTHPLMISTSPDTVAEPSEYRSADTLYFSVALLNSGNVDAPQCPCAIVIDGKTVANFRLPAIPPGNNFFRMAVYSTKLSSGTHRCLFEANPGHTIPESNFGDDDAGRTITVQGQWG